jgi:hypothetical protein
LKASADGREPPADADGLSRGGFERLFAPPDRDLAVCALVQAAVDLSAVRVEPNDPDTTTDEPPGCELDHVADAATCITVFCSIDPNKANTATNEPPISGREDAANDPTDDDRQHVNRGRIRLHYEPPRTGVNK